MKRDTGFHDFVVHDLLYDIPELKSKGMFGGWGLYAGDVFFAIITEGELYVKGDPELIALYQSLGSHPFTYDVKGRAHTLSYWLVPEEVFEDRDELARWVDAAIAVQKERKR